MELENIVPFNRLELEAPVTLLIHAITQLFNHTVSTKMI